MIIIGEKINGAIPAIGEAIKNRDRECIENLARIQEECGADYLDVCAGTLPGDEFAALSWLIEVVQGASSLPLCLDSPDPQILAALIGEVARPGIMNSISGEGNKCEVLLPVLKANPEWQLVALCCDDSEIAISKEDKVRIAIDLIEKALQQGIDPERIHLDPCVLALSAVSDSAMSFCGSMAEIKQRYPTVRIAAALSNVSFGMPMRSLINRSFLVMAMSSGLNTGILDPTNKALRETIYATEALLGNDRHCRIFNGAYRSGIIGTSKDQ
jgi:5-methyltetrahydrofolate--homocysteine methyltransferase